MPVFIINLYLFCMAVMAIVGGIVLKNDPRARINQVFFLFTGFSILWMASLYLGFFFAASSEELSLLFIRLAFGFPCFWYFSLVAFFYYFPQKTLRVPRALRYLGIASALGFFVMASFTPLVEQAVIIEDGALVGDVFGPMYGVYTSYFLALLAVALGLIVKKALGLHGLEKRKLLLAGTGFIAFLTLTVMTNVVLPLYGMLIFQLESPAFSLLFLLPTFYAIQKYRFFDFSYASLKALRSVILFASFCFVSIGIFELLTTFTVLEQSVVIHSVSAVAGLAFLILVNRNLPELISSSFRHFRAEIQDFQSSIFYCKNYQQLIHMLEKSFVMKLQISQAKIFLVRDQKSSIKLPIYLRDPFCSQLETQHKMLVVEEELRLKNTPKNSSWQKALEKMEASLCMPLYLDKKMIGLFFLGKKANQEPYNREELEEILKARKSVEICFINILLQSDLKEENNLMKNIIQERTQTLREQNEEIKKLLRQQSDFLAITAHEFRTPLNIALLQLEDTLESYDMSAHLLDDMQTMAKSLEKLKTLTRNLFDVQQYDFNKVQLRSSSNKVEGFIGEIYEEFEDLIQQEKILFDLDTSELNPHTTAEFDADQMRQVIHNLLGNALKFTPPGGSITLVAREHEDQISFSVQDTGPGIPKEDQERIFEKFQSTNVTMGVGIGLGLYLCKKILELHHGTIGVRNNADGGATFTVSFPKKAPEYTAPKP